MEVRINGFNMESDDFTMALSDDEGEGDVGAEGVPEDVGKQSKEGRADIKDEKEKEVKDYSRGV